MCAAAARLRRNSRRDNTRSYRSVAMRNGCATRRTASAAAHASSLPTPSATSPNESRAVALRSSSNTIGPFTRTALPIARACPRGCHYVDISNELYSVIFDDAIVARMNFEHDLPTILFGTTLQPVPQPLDNQLVDDATLLGEDA